MTHCRFILHSKLTSGGTEELLCNSLAGWSKGIRFFSLGIALHLSPWLGNIPSLTAKFQLAAAEQSLPFHLARMRNSRGDNPRVAHRRSRRHALLLQEGGGGGFHCMMRLYPGDGIGTVVMTDATGFDVRCLFDTMDA